MAAPAVVRSSGPPLYPSFAEVCSFLERYGPALDLPEMTFPQLERYLRDTTAVSKPLVDLHVKLLRKLGKSVTTDRWEKYLAKVCQELNSTWAWELEQKGYQEMSMECKSSILKYLCECQFDDNLKFKMMINDEDPEKMRLQPVGRDRQGLLYWMQLDQEQNIRLYTEEQDDLDGSTWRCIVRTRNDLAEALELLKTQVEPNQNQEQNLAESRSTSPTGRGTGEANEIKDAKSSNTTEQADKIKMDHDMEKKPIKQELKQEQTQEIEQENRENEVKEEKTDNKKSVFDNRVSTITAIKPEPRDVAKNAVSVLTASSVTKLNVDEEAERAAVRSNLQAKIPLKKRDLKLADSFHTNHINSNSSSIIVCNPAVIQSKDSHGREGNFLNSVAPVCGPAATQQHQLANSAAPELTNGRASLFQPYKEGQNGVVGVIGHIGVIRSPSELHRASGSERQEQNGPSLEPSRAVKEEKEVSRQSVLVRKVPAEIEPASSAFPLHEISESQTCKAPQSLKVDKLPEVTDKKVDPAGASSLCQPTGETKTPKEEEPSQEATEETTEEEFEKGKNAGQNSHQQKDHGLKDTRKEGLERDLQTEEPEKPSGNSSQVCTESDRCASPQKTEKPSKTEQEEKGVNGGFSGPAKGKRSLGSGSEQERCPLEEASSELQKEGIRLKIKIPPHRRNKLRGKRGKGQEKDTQKEQEEGRLLRRSARICRSSSLPTCRPSSKVTESQRKKPQTKQALPPRVGDEDEAEEEEDEEEQISASKENRKLVGEVRKLRGKRRHRRPRWSNIRTKRRKLNDDEAMAGRGRKDGGEGRSDSEVESCKSTEIPSEDCCSHCGLPNHPELILLCDSCDSGYHTACLRPPVMLIPDGEWFCPPCQHKLLCEKLEEQLQNLDSALKKRERAERRRERLVYVGISVENIIPEEDKEEEEKATKKKDCKKSKNLGRRSTRTRKHISYRFDDFDDAIDEAIEEDFGDLCGGAGKDIASILSEDVERPIRSQTRASRSRRRRRLNDLESDSTAAESEDEFMLSNSSEEECGASGPDDDEEEEEDMGSDGGSWDKGTKPRRALKGVPRQKPGRARRRGRKRQLRRSEEESEEVMDSDQYSDLSDSDHKRRGLRRGQHQQVNYRETSESSDSSRVSADEKKSKARTRKEALSSDYSDSFLSSKESEEDDYEEDDDDRRLIGRRREKEFRKSRTIEKRRRYKHDEDRGQQRRRRHLEKVSIKDRRSRLRKDEEEEDLEKMGRGRRREILYQQRRRRLAQMLKKRRPSTDEEEEESEDSESSSEEDRPIRKRLNRIDSDDEEDDDEDVRRKTKKPSGGERTSDARHDSDSQERGRGQSPSPNEHQTSRGLQKPGSGSLSVPRDSLASDRQSRHNGPWHPEEEEEDEEGQTDSVNSVQNSPRS
uniref:PHD-type domain-containing protein n=1 Tax=Oryzias latipes TaxID=8090 RepID=A0A3P9HBN3_ORYLA